MTAGAKEGWLEIFMRDVTLDRTSKEEEDAAAVLKNDLAYHYLVMTCTDNVVLKYVQATETVDSHGDVRKAWKGLYERYRSITENDLVALSTEYDNCKMKKASDNPCWWYAELEYLQLWMECAGAQKKTEAEVVATIMNWVPAEYKVVTSALRAKPVKEQTLDLVRTVYWEYWDANLKSVEQPNESDESVALYTDSGKQSDDKKDKTEGDAFFIGMSMNEEVFHHRTRSQQQEYKEFLRRKNEQFIQELFGSKEEPKPKRRPRGCTVCGTEGLWYLVCDECKVSPEKLEH